VANGKVVIHEDEMRRFREAVGLGALNFGHAVEGAAKREAPVRGGYRSFMTTKTGKAGQVLIGGTLRRSIHAAAWVDGRRVGSSGSDENGNDPPDYSPGPGIVVVIGTNSTYGAYVELGTSRMAERPFLGPAFEGQSGSMASLIRAGMKRGGY
jgi:HK97 gp10 family phage protein